MAIYVVMEEQPSSKHAVYVADRFSLIAFLVPLLWLLWHRLWIEAAVLAALAIVLAGLGNLMDLTGLVVILPALLACVFVGFEGPMLRVAALKRRGWHEWGVVEAETRNEAETRHLLDPSVPASLPERDTATVPPHPVGAAPSRPALGLLDYPARG